MSSKRTIDERLIEKNEQLKKAMETAKQYQTQLRQLEKQKAQEDRKKRTKRLIEIGSAVESVLGRDFGEGDIVRLINFLRKQNERGNFFTQAMELPLDESSKKPTAPIPKAESEQTDSIGQFHSLNRTADDPDEDFAFSFPATK
ncbi:MAG: DUF3847 domain-containing protein [Lachnospiraceae bacterium]|nr:DUF3847 domain-containing protein [Lachnospiraceae bacterium]